MGAKSSRPVHSADDVLIRSAQIIDTIVHFVSRLFGRFFVDLFAPAPPSRLCDDNGVCLVPATRLQASKDRKRRAEERMRRAAAAAAGLDPRVELSRQNTRDSTATGLSRRNTRTQTYAPSGAATPRVSPRLNVVGLPPSPPVDVHAALEKVELNAQQRARKEKRRSSTAQPLPSDARTKAGDVKAAAGKMLENAKHKAEEARIKADQLVDKANAVEAGIKAKAGQAKDRAGQLYEGVREQAAKLEHGAGEALARTRHSTAISEQQKEQVNAMLGEPAKAPAPRPEIERQTNKEREKVAKEKKLWVMGNVAPSASSSVPVIVAPPSIVAVLAEPTPIKPVARMAQPAASSSMPAGPVPGRMAALLAPPAAVVRKSSKKGRGERDDGLMGEKAGTPATHTLKAGPVATPAMEPLVISRRDRELAKLGHVRRASLNDVPEGRHSRRTSTHENVTYEVVASSDITAALQAAAEQHEAEEKKVKQRRKRVTAPPAPSAATALQVGQAPAKEAIVVAEEKYVLVDAPVAIEPPVLVAPIAKRGPVLVAPRPTRPSTVARNAERPSLDINTITPPARSSTLTPPPRSSTASPSVLTPFFSKALASLEAVRSWSPSNATGFPNTDRTSTSTPPTPVSATPPNVVSPRDMANAACKSRKESTARERRMWRDEVNRTALYRMHETRTRSPAFGAGAASTVGSSAGTGVTRHLQNPTARMGAANTAVLNAGRTSGSGGGGAERPCSPPSVSAAPAAPAQATRRPKSPGAGPKTLSAGVPGLLQQPVERRAERA